PAFVEQLPFLPAEPLLRAATELDEPRRLKVTRQVASRLNQPSRERSLEAASALAEAGPEAVECVRGEAQREPLITGFRELERLSGVDPQVLTSVAVDMLVTRLDQSTGLLLVDEEEGASVRLLLARAWSGGLDDARAGAVAGALVGA